MADSRHIKKMDKLLYLNNSLIYLNEILHADAQWPSKP